MAKRKLIQITYAEGDPIKGRWDAAADGRKNHETLDALLAVYENAPREGEPVEPVETPADFGALVEAITSEANATGLPLNAMIDAAIQAFNEKVCPDGQGAAKIASTVRDVMMNNVEAKDWFDREAITGSGVFARTGSNQGSIRKWLKENAALIDAHHEKMGITDDPATHNRRAAQHRRANKG